MSRFPTKNRAAVGGSLENFILDRNFQSRSKSRIFLIFGPSGLVTFELLLFFRGFGASRRSAASQGLGASGNPRRTLKSRPWVLSSTFELSQCWPCKGGGCLGRGEVFQRPPAVCSPERPRLFTHSRVATPAGMERSQIPQIAPKW